MDTWPRSSNGSNELRYAIYYVPDPATELAMLGARWLGRSIETGATFGPPATRGLDVSDHARLVAAARRYGFHATLKAPFHLAEGRTRDELLSAFRSFARAACRVRIPVISVGRLRRFIALVPALHDEDLTRLATDAEHHFERFRAPLSPQDAARRRGSGLTPRQLRNLERYGYPFILNEFRFHLTLTSPVDHDNAATVERAIEEFFKPVLGRDLVIDRVALVEERVPGGDFTVAAVAALGDPLAYTRRAMHVEAHYGEIGFVRPTVGRHNRGPADPNR